MDTGRPRAAVLKGAQAPAARAGERPRRYLARHSYRHRIQVEIWHWTAEVPSHRLDDHLLLRTCHLRHHPTTGDSGERMAGGIAAQPPGEH